MLLLAYAAPSVGLAQELKHEKYQLPNGMTVILHEDHSLPVAGVNLWYRVGARNEPPGRSGFAHLFEHLMFMGTKRVPGSDFDMLMEAGGGSNNASTELDRTNYFSSGPASLLPTLLWLDADRLEDLGSFMTKEKLDLQRDVVRNELRQSVENAPYGRATEMSYQILFPAGHPYHNGVIGTHQDLESATVDDVKNFFATFYTPENCSLVVAGDFDSATIKPMVAELFGTLPRGNAPLQAVISTPALGRVARITALDKVQLPKTESAYLSPGNYQDGDAEMELAANILADGPGSRLFDRLVVKDKVAVSVNADQEDGALSSVFRVTVLARPGADLATIEGIVDEELARLVSTGPTVDEVKKQAAIQELSTLSRLQNVQLRADKLNEYEYYYGNPDSLKRDLDRFRNATPAGVQAWAKKVLTPDSRLITRVLPEDPSRPGNARDAKPSAVDSPAFTPPLPETFTLSNGVPVSLWKKDGLPLVSMSVMLLPGGKIGSSVDHPSKPGLADLMADLTQQGAGDRDSAGFADAVRALGASIIAGAQPEAVSVSMSVLARNFEPASQLLADSIIRPRMTQADFDRVQRVTISGLEQQKQNPAAVAGQVAAKMLLGDANAYGVPISGTPESVKSLGLDDLKKAHAELFTPGNARVLVAGSISAEQAKAALEKAFSGWAGKAGGGTALDARLVAPAAKGLRVYLVDRPDAVQTAISFEGPGLSASDSGRVPAELAGVILGGTFTSRLNHNLREVHGYTYGARARVTSHASLGVFSAATAVRADATGPALKEFLGELNSMAGGDITDGELQKARETARHAAAEQFATMNSTLGAAAGLIVDGVGFDQTAKDLQTINGVTLDALNAAARGLIKMDQSVLVLVGDKSLVLEQIKGLGLAEPVLVDEEGRVKAGR